MTKTGKIVWTSIGAIAIFAVGVQYSPQVIAFVNSIKNNLTGNKTDDAISALKDKITTDFMSVPEVTGVSVQTDANDPNGRQFVMVTVKDAKTAGTIQKYIEKNNLGSQVQVSISSKTVAK